LPQELLDNWTLYYSQGMFTPTEHTILSFIRTCVQFDLWNYFFGELPIDIAMTISKEAINLAQILGGDKAISETIGYLENKSVDQAVQTALDYLFKTKLRLPLGQ